MVQGVTHCQSGQKLKVSIKKITWTSPRSTSDSHEIMKGKNKIDEQKLILWTLKLSEGFE